VAVWLLGFSGLVFGGITVLAAFFVFVVVYKRALIRCPIPETACPISKHLHG